MRNAIEVPESRGSGTKWARWLFFAALVFNAWGVSVGWRSLNLPGCEFRQTQTALSALFIQRENNFSLAYPTPVLGKPWSIPFEFPLYQWTVVRLSNATGWSLTSSGRAVSVACFYLALPAFYLLLRHLGWKQVHRLLSLALILSCPLYVFYGRAFLIETMALLFGAWFLLAYLEVVAGRWMLWMPVAIVSGAACGLVKVTTFLFVLMPALGGTLWWLYRDLRLPEERWGALTRRALRGLAAGVIPCVAALWWVRYADGIKAASPAGLPLQSAHLTDYNFGIGVRFSADLWRSHWQILFQEITSWPVLLICGGLTLFVARRVGWIVLGLAGLFLAVQVVFPVLYAWHAYYYVANAFVLMMAFGIVLGELLESRAARPLAWLVVLGVFGLQAHTYFGYYYPGQAGISQGGDNLTTALRRVTAPDEVVVVAGDDWSSMIPYYAERRAFMIRRGQESDWDAVLPVFYRLADEDVTALVLRGAQVENRELLRRAAERFGLDPAPAFALEGTVVYLHRSLRHRSLPELKTIPGLKVFDPAPEAPAQREIITSEALKRDQAVLPSFKDRRSGTLVRPFKYQSSYGIAPFQYEGRTFLSVHPTVQFWFKLGSGNHRFAADAMLLPGAYATTMAPEQRSDGVEIRLELESSDGSRSTLFSRVINPRDQPADAGVQRLGHGFELQEEGVVVLSVHPGPHGNASCDWAVLGGVDFE